jgi:hypothetical protein
MRRLSLAVMFVLAVSLFGCGDDPASMTSSTSQAPPATSTTLSPHGRFEVRQAGEWGESEWLLLATPTADGVCTRLEMAGSSVPPDSCENSQQLSEDVLRAQHSQRLAGNEGGVWGVVSADVSSLRFQPAGGGVPAAASIANGTFALRVDDYDAEGAIQLIRHGVTLDCEVLGRVTELLWFCS